MPKPEKPPITSPRDAYAISRRSAIKSSILAAGAAALAPGQMAAARPSKPRPDQRRYDMKKSINLWALPYPEQMTLEECLETVADAGFEGVELNFDLESDLSPDASTSDLHEIRDMAERVGLEISGLCSFLFWPYPLTSNDPEKRARGLELAEMMTRAAHELGTDNLLVVPGAVHIPWEEDHEPTSFADCDQRAHEAIEQLLPLAEDLGVHLNLENIFFNGYLMTPGEMIDFVDRYDSEYLRVHFDTGNIKLFHFPEHWIEELGPRIKNTHLKEYDKESTDHTLRGFRPLLDGTTNWPAVMDALEGAGYDSWVTFEYFQPYRHYPEALIHHTSDAMDRILGRTT